MFAKGSKLPQKMERLILEKGQNEATKASLWVRENDQNLLQVKQVHHSLSAMLCGASDQNIQVFYIKH